MEAVVTAPNSDATLVKVILTADAEVIKAADIAAAREGSTDGEDDEVNQ